MTYTGLPDFNTIRGTKIAQVILFLLQRIEKQESIGGRLIHAFIISGGEVRQLWRRLPGIIRFRGLLLLHRLRGNTPLSRFKPRLPDDGGYHHRSGCRSPRGFGSRDMGALVFILEKAKREGHPNLSGRGTAELAKGNFLFNSSYEFLPFQLATRTRRRR